MMVITRTPFRMSFFGGGTDYPAFYREHGGAVLNTTINKYCYITVRHLPPFFPHKFRIRYTDREETQTVDQIQHPSVRECLRFMEITDGIEMIHTSDIPAMSGIGSSSSFTVGFLNALNAMRGKMITKRQLAYDAIHIEQDLIRENVGSQDQVAAAFGGFNRIDFGGKQELFVQPVPLTDAVHHQLQESLMFYFTGFSRVASEIAQEQIKNTPARTTELKTMHQMVDEAISILNGGVPRIHEFGKLLHESWKFKKSLSDRISNSCIDEIYDTALREGAVGGKICGAGGGGFLLLFVPPENQPRIREVFKNMLLVPFRFESLASHAIFYAQ